MEISKEEILAKCNQWKANTLMGTLDIDFVDITDTSIVARMPVTPKVHQPDGVLHGGATVALAETVGSAGAYIFLADKDIQIRGIEISANHVKGVSEGYVYAKAEIVHKGRTMQLWQIRVTTEDDALVSLIKLTTLSLSKK